MNIEHSKLLADKCNQYGVLVNYEIVGVQHEFQLSMKNLSPSAVIFKRNQKHFTGTKYVLLPTDVAKPIKNVGRELFSTKYYEDSKGSNKYLTGFDYCKTHFGKYLRIESIDKFQVLVEILSKRMRIVARNEIHDEYKRYYKNSFLIAYEYFFGGLSEFRELMDKYSGGRDLFWDEILDLYNELNTMMNTFQRANPKTKFSFGNISEYASKEKLPGLQAAYKLKNVPKTMKEYEDSLGIIYVFTGLHPEGFIKRSWTQEMEKIDSYDAVKRYSLLPESYLFKPVDDGPSKITK